MHVTIHVESGTVGPAEPENPTGDREIRTTNTGSRLVRQEYADGIVFELQVKRGSQSLEDRQLLWCIPEGLWMDVHNPWDAGDISDEFLYISVWCPR